jgi:hypothetical protein
VKRIDLWRDLKQAAAPEAAVAYDRVNGMGEVFVGSKVKGQFEN